MKQVTKEEFYAYVMDQDAIVNCDNSHSSIYQLRYTGKIIGKVLDSADKADADIGEGNTYFIAN